MICQQISKIFNVSPSPACFVWFLRVARCHCMAHHANLFLCFQAYSEACVESVSQPVSQPVTACAQVIKVLTIFPVLSPILCCDGFCTTEQAVFFSRDTLELVKRVELPGLPSSYHIVNAFQEGTGEGKTVTTVVIAQLRDGGREKLESTFKDLMHKRYGEDITGSRSDRSLLLSGRNHIAPVMYAKCVAREFRRVSAHHHGQSVVHIVSWTYACWGLTRMIWGSCETQAPVVRRLLVPWGYFGTKTAEEIRYTRNASCPGIYIPGRWVSTCHSSTCRAHTYGTNKLFFGPCHYHPPLL